MAISPSQPQPPEKFSLLERPRPNALANLKAGQPRRAKPVDYSEALPAQYNRQMQAIISAINEEIKRDIIPAIYQAKPEYIADAWPTMMNALLTALASRWTGTMFETHADRIAAGTVRRIEAVNGKAFLKSVNQAVGIEVFGSHTGALATELEAAALENAQLIKNVSEQYINKVQSTVMSRMRGGYAPSVIAKDLQEQAGITRARAKLIARDQTAKLNSDLTRLRNTAAGIAYFRWNDSGDQRVSGDPGGRYPDAKVKCFRIALADVGYGPGVYTWKNGASYAGEKRLFPGKAHVQCRCSATPVFEWELPGKG